MDALLPVAAKHFSLHQGAWLAELVLSGAAVNIG
jgi:hypothetical protein